MSYAGKLGGHYLPEANDLIEYLQRIGISIYLKFLGLKRRGLRNWKKKIVPDGRASVCDKGGHSYP